VAYLGEAVPAGKLWEPKALAIDVVNLTDQDLQAEFFLYSDVLFQRSLSTGYVQKFEKGKITSVVIPIENTLLVENNWVDPNIYGLDVFGGTPPVGDFGYNFKLLGYESNLL